MSVSLFCDSLLGGAAAGRTSTDRQRSSTRQDTTDAVLSSITFKTKSSELHMLRSRSPKLIHSKKSKTESMYTTTNATELREITRSKFANWGNNKRTWKLVLLWEGWNPPYMMMADDCFQLTSACCDLLLLVCSKSQLFCSCMHLKTQTAAIVWFRDRRSLCDEGYLQQYTVSLSK